MKKVISIILFISFLAPIGGTLMWFKIEQKSLRKEIKKHLIAGVEDSELTLLTFSEEETKTLLDWKHDKEFAFKGVMYDIVKSRVEKGTYYYWCWKDDQETLLYKKLEQLVASALGNDTNQNQKQFQLRLFHQSLFYKQQYSWSPPYLLETIPVKNYFYHIHYSSITHTPNPPPPIFS